MTDRATMIALLEDVSPALASVTTVPVLQHFWFTGTHLMAFNERIALSVPCKTELQGAVPKTLLPILKSSRAETIELLSDGDVLTVKAGSSKIKLPMIGPEEFIFQIPKPKAKKAMGVDAARFVQNLEACMLSLGTHTHSIDFLGVTVMLTDTHVLMYSTDGETVSAGKVAYEGNIPMVTDRNIMPTEFCKQFLRAAKGAEDLWLELHDDYALFEHEGLTLYGRMIAPDSRALPFKKQIGEAVDHADSLVPIPAELIPILERAVLITERSVDKAKTLVTVEGNKMYFTSKSERGEADESVAIKSGHDDDVECQVDARRLIQGAMKYEKMLITSKFVMMTRDRMIYLIAAQA